MYFVTTGLLLMCYNVRGYFVTMYAVNLD